MIAAGPLRLATAAMGTRFELVLGGDQPERWRSEGEAALAEIEECHRRLSRFAADSLVSHIHRTAWRSPVRLDRDTFALFRDALDVHAASDGAFDVTVGRLMARLGFHRDDPATGAGRGNGDNGSQPVARMNAQPAGLGEAGAPAASITLDPVRHTIRLADESTRIDLGAIAKGHALDMAARVLREYGVDCALLHGGTSSVLAIGAPPDRSGWGIALEGFAKPLLLRDAALAVSAGSGRTVAGCNGRLGHIVDPRTGRSVPAARRAAVAGPSARLCDAWATALAVLGERPATLGPEWTTFLDAM